MQFDVFSDIHVEFHEMWKYRPDYDNHENEIYPWHLEKQSDTILIAGDCGNDPLLSCAVLQEARKNYDTVIFTDGNHDHYNGKDMSKTTMTVSKNTAVFEEFANMNDGIIYLDGTSHQIDDTLFIGANGWYDWTANRTMLYEQQKAHWKQYMSDADYIAFDTGEQPDVIAGLQAGMLRMKVEAAQDDDSINRIVVMTHTIPHRKGMVDDSHAWGHLNGSFMNCFMEQVWIADKKNKIKFWNFGHTHFSYDFMAEGIRFLNNARGYPRERNKPRIIQVDLDDVR